MKLVLLLTILPIGANSIAAAQTDGDNYQAIIEKTILTGGLDAHVEKHLKTVGDLGSIEIARAISDKKLTAPQMLLVLTLIEDSFSEISQITSDSNRAPRVALLLVRYIEIAAERDANVQRAVIETRQALQKAVSNSTK